MATPRVNFFIHYVPCLDGLGLNNNLVKKYLKERQFYACEQSYNYLGYINDGSKTKIDFVDYSGNNEKSTGLFDENGLCSQERIKELKQGFRLTKSVIWHGLISFEEMFGKENCNSYEKAYSLMKNEFPRFLSSAGLEPKNIVWCAGFHTNTDHRHIHFAFYEKEPTKFRKTQNKKCFSYGQITKNSIEKAKIRTELYLLNNNTELIDTRKAINSDFKANLSLNFLKNSVLKTMKSLIPRLPSEGRLSYDSDNMHFLRAEIDNLTVKIIKQNKNLQAKYQKFIALINEKDKSILDMCKNSKIAPEKYLLSDKYQQDLYRRLGNQIIKFLLSFKYEINKNKYQTNNRLAKKRIERNKSKYLIEKSLYLSEKTQKEAFNYFEEHMKKLQQLNIEVLMEQGVIEL